MKVCSEFQDTNQVLLGNTCRLNGSNSIPES